MVIIFIETQKKFYWVTRNEGLQDTFHKIYYLVFIPSFGCVLLTCTHIYAHIPPFPSVVNLNSCTVVPSGGSYTNSTKLAIYFAYP